MRNDLKPHAAGRHAHAEAKVDALELQNIVLHTSMGGTSGTSGGGFFSSAELASLTTDLEPATISDFLRLLRGLDPESRTRLGYN